MYDIGLCVAMTPFSKALLVIIVVSDILVCRFAVCTVDKAEFKVRPITLGTVVVTVFFNTGAAVVTLYVAEGTKSDHIFEFTNADPYLIRFMSIWMRSYCNIDESRLRGAIWLHEENNELLAKEYWSRISGVPIDQFQKTYISKKRDSKKIRKNLHKYGIFSLRISDVRVTRRLMGWICGIFSESWYNNKVKERFAL